MRNGGREFLAETRAHISSASDWWNAQDPGSAVAMSYPGLVALGVPEGSLAKFSGAFRVGMAARAEKLRDYGVNDPKNWDGRSVADELQTFKLQSIRYRTAGPSLRSLLRSHEASQHAQPCPHEMLPENFAESLPARPTPPAPDSSSQHRDPGVWRSTNRGRTDVRRESPQELTAAVRIVDVQEKVRAKYGSGRKRRTVA